MADTGVRSRPAQAGRRVECTPGVAPGRNRRRRPLPGPRRPQAPQGSRPSTACQCRPPSAPAVRQPRAMDLRRLWLLLPLVTGLWLAAPAAAADRPAARDGLVLAAGPSAPGGRPVRRAGRAVRARAPGRRPAGARRLPRARGCGRHRGLRRPGGGRGVVSVDHPGGLRTTYEPVAARVSAWRPGDPRERAGRARAGPEPLRCAGLPALGCAPGRDLPRPAGPGGRGPGPPAAGVGRRGAPRADPSDGWRRCSGQSSDGRSAASRR